VWLCLNSFHQRIDEALFFSSNSVSSLIATPDFRFKHCRCSVMHSSTILWLLYLAKALIPDTPPVMYVLLHLGEKRMKVMPSNHSIATCTCQ
jgi:hypothetical protein